MANWRLGFVQPCPLFRTSIVLCHFFICRNSPPVDQGLLIYEDSRSHTTTHHSRQDSCGRVVSSSQRLLPENTQHSQQTNIHAPGGIRTHNLSRRAAADLCLRPRGHWDWHFCAAQLTLRLLMSYIYIHTHTHIHGAPILDVSRSHTTMQHSR